MFTFKEFLTSLDEDAEADIAKLNITKQQLILKKTAAITPLDTQINNADKQLMQKEKQKVIDDKRKGVITQQSAQRSNTQTRTPGSTGAATPGQGAATNTNI
jgi:hypothetical protein